jgi:sulfite reductase (NADPH) hemoprotein beta-component
LPPLSSIHRQVQLQAEALSAHLTPATRAYHEIWLDGEKLVSSEAEREPIYGDTYLPRKFKTAFVVPPRNDTDVFAQDLGYIAIVERGRIAGYNVTVGGGMGMSHGESATYPRLADVLGFCTAEQVIAVAEAVVTAQRDYGDRTNRKHARLKYTIDDRGIDWLRSEVERRLGAELETPRQYAFVGNGDVYGWQQDDNGAWHYTLFVQNGRVADVAGRRLKSGLGEVAARHRGEFRLTPNQNLIISNVAGDQKQEIENLLARYGIGNDAQATQLRLHSMACVALPTCALAMAESERYLPSLIDRLDEILAGNGLTDDAITIRMTGCPNGCARPYIAEIGLVGKGPGTYNLYLGAGFAGDRLGCLYRENVSEAQIIDALAPLFAAYATARDAGERFGDFVVRRGVVPRITAGRLFHAGRVDE